MIAVVWLACVSSSAPASPPPGPTPASRAVERFVHRWVDDWEARAARFDAYASRYAPNFRAAYRGMDRDAWLADKRAKVSGPGCVDVTVRELRQRDVDGQVEVSFIQKFVGDAFCDEGPKTLLLAREESSFMIVSEDQPSATPCADRCLPPGDPADPVGSYLRSCATLFPGVVSGEGSLVDYPEDECRFHEFDQSCEPDPDGCDIARSACEARCRDGCGTCQATCTATCEACRAPCADDACARPCAEARASCRRTCVDPLGTCLSACREAETTCQRAGDDAVKSACPRCAEMAACKYDEACRARFAEEPAVCLARCLPSDM